MYIRRKIHSAIHTHLEKKEYTIITGARQTGKTSLLQAIFEELKNGGATVNYMSFEDRDVLSACNIHPEEIFAFSPRPEKIWQAGSEKRKPFYLLIDEIQYANDPSNFMKYLYDTYGENLKIVATGSSAFYMDSKFKDSLAGRKRLFELQTLDFMEFLIFKNAIVLAAELETIRSQEGYISTGRFELQSMLNEYMVFGGYPAVVLENEKEEKINRLKEIRNSFLKRDIDESGIANHDKFYNLLTILAGQTGNLVNRNELSNTIGLDNKTIDKYLHVLQQCFHIVLVKPFYSNLRKEITRMPKIYFKDLGLRNAALNRFFDFHLREDQGALLKNYVLLRLTGMFDSDAIRFWRTTKNIEVDFVVSLSFKKGYAIEVKLKYKNSTSNSVKKFIDHYPEYEPVIISYAYDKNCKWVLKL
ncbi:MAG: ATP-binding protein [Bacteroidales bacterium]|nr:ATP-binding protein [Bacteroidales bacterium]